MYTNVSDMPFRMTTREVAAVLRISVAAFSARRRAGRYQIEPVERGQENLFDRRDVLRLLGRTEDSRSETPVEAEVPSWGGGYTDPDAFNAARFPKRALGPKRGG